MWSSPASRGIVSAALAPGQLATGAFNTLETGKVGARDRVHYKQSTSELFNDADGLGKTAPVKFGMLENKAALTICLRYVKYKSNIDDRPCYL